MSIRVLCPSCQKKLNAKEELAGKRVKCPGCGQVLVVAAPDPELEAPNEDTPARDRSFNMRLYGLANRLHELSETGDGIERATVTLLQIPAKLLPMIASADCAGESSIVMGSSKP